jgi:hypothetical protein
MPGRTADFVSTWSNVLLLLILQELASQGSNTNEMQASIASIGNGKSKWV